MSGILIGAGGSPLIRYVLNGESIFKSFSYTRRIGKVYSPVSRMA